MSDRNSSSQITGKQTNSISSSPSATVPSQSARPPVAPPNPMSPKRTSAPAPRNLGEILLRLAYAPNRVGEAFFDGVREGVSEGEPIGMSPDTEQQLRDLGLFIRPGRPIGAFPEVFTEPVIRAGDMALDLIRKGALGVGLGAGRAAGQLTSELGGSQGMARRAERDISGLISQALRRRVSL